MKKLLLLAASLFVAASVFAAACGDDDNGNGDATPAASPTAASGAEGTPQGNAGGTLTVYSGRSQSLVEELINQFTADTGIQVDVRYAGTAELAATILEEGNNSPADVFFGQDAGALGALAKEGRLVELPESILSQVPERYRSDDGLWVGVSGRARVVVYNTNNVTEDELPDAIDGFTDSAWSGRIGWAPTNGSFQSFVTAMRVMRGDDATKEWLEGIKANNPREFEGNAQALAAVDSGEVDVAFINHYYLYQLRAEGGGANAANYYIEGEDPGALVNIAGAGIVNTSDNQELAQQFIEYLLSEKAQRYFAEETNEYPMIDGVQVNPDLVPIDQLQAPSIDLSDLDDLDGTLVLLREAGVLP